MKKLIFKVTTPDWVIVRDYLHSLQSLRLVWSWSEFNFIYEFEVEFDADKE